MPFIPGESFMRGSTLIPARLAAGALIAALASGCYVPGGGWTLRSGLDTRTCRKPALYMEMVDTRWDEWSRVAQMNSMPAQYYPPPGVHPGDGPLAVPGPEIISPSQNPSSNGTPSHSEPHQVPGLPPEKTIPLPPPPGPSAKTESVNPPALYVADPAVAGAGAIVPQSASIVEIDEEWRPIPISRMRSQQVKQNPTSSKTQIAAEAPAMPTPATSSQGLQGSTNAVKSTVASPQAPAGTWLFSRP